MYELTRIAGCCASSTECSDHNIEKKLQLFFSVERRFFLRGLIKKRNPKLQAHMTLFVELARRTTVFFEK